MRPRRKKHAIVFELLLGCMLLLAAYGLTTTIRGVYGRVDDASVRSEYDAVRLALAAQEERYASLLEQNREIVERRDTLYAVLNDPSLNPILVSEWQDAALLAGMTPLEGEGLVVVLDDKDQYNPLVDPVESLIHDKTLLHVLNLLVDYGGFALSVNDIRITSVSQIYCIGPTILCNTHRLVQPYEIHVLGDAQTLQSALENDLVLQRLRSTQYGVRLSINASTSVRVPSFADSGDYTRLISLLERESQR